MKKVIASLLCLLAAVYMAACGQSDVQEPLQPGNTQDGLVEVSLWCYPVGNWETPSAVSSLITDFRRLHPEIVISTTFLEYDTGDNEVNAAINSGAAPDLVLESPERMVASWGGQGLMADLSDLWAEPPSDEIYDFIRGACRHNNGEYYIYPICTSAHCMAINYDLFQAAGALQYLDEENRTWTTEGFVKAVEALRAYGQEKAGAVYCGGQGGDQGTRALVNNLYGGSFADEDHTHYIADSEENIRALELLYNLDGIVFDPSIAGVGEIEAFCRGELAMAFCWNSSQEVIRTVKNPDLDFQLLPMPFPTSAGNPRLQNGIWGFGIFDNGDDARIAAAKEFIRYIAGSDTQYVKAVRLANSWPVRKMENIYPNDALMSEYSMFIPYVDNYYQITPNWANARTLWWTMLQKVGRGEDIAAALEEFQRKANAPLHFEE